MTAQEAFRSLADCMTLESSEAFFAHLVERLADILCVNHALVARILPDGHHASTLAVWSHNKQCDNFTYPLANTPCEQVIGKRACFFPSRVCEHFPHDTILLELGAEAYLGIPMFGPDGQPHGLLAILNDQPMDNAGLAEEVLRIAAARGGAELAHQDAEKQRERHERELVASNRALTLFSRCNEMLVHADHEDTLLQDICRLAVDIGGYRMAWVGYAQDDGHRPITPRASAGAVDNYLDGISLSWSETHPHGQGPSGKSIRSGEPQFVDDLANDPSCVPWVDAALSHGYHGIISLPLKNSDSTFGVLVLYQAATDPITDDERRLLSELANDLAFGIDILRARQRQQRIQHAVVQISTAVTPRSGDAYFLQLCEHMASALGADASFMARILASPPQAVEPLAAIIEGKQVENTCYDLTGTLCERTLRDGALLVNSCSVEDVSSSSRDALHWVKAYAGQRLDNSSGEPIGLLTVLFRKPIEDIEFVTSILQIFAAGAAAELQRQSSEAHIRRLAYTDASTQLPNRMAFREHLDSALLQAPNQLALLLLDLSRFKEINDIHGHDVGDLILANVAKRLKHSLEANEFLARLGGDEFVVVLTETDSQAAIQCARRLQAALVPPFIVRDQAFSLEAGIGIAFYPDHASSASELLQHTDIAMHQAKQQASRYCQYQPVMGHNMASRLGMARRLADAIDQDRLQLYYQAQVDLVSGDLIGAEALCRWHDDELGWVSPGVFIPLAEERGMIGRLGNWVIEASCRQLAAWRYQGLHLSGQLAINVATQQLDDQRLMHTLTQAAKKYDIAPRQLSLELTESSFMTDPEQAISMTDALKSHGFGLAIDDFGTGYSSLAHLKRFAADKIKIDMSFVRDMLTDPSDHAIVKTIIAMAQNLDLETIAEGIETAEQVEALQALGCHQAQGFFFSRPQSAEHFASQWLGSSC
ncbi:bifunctional diguanylate cyclase/phosphodiesterase [Litchfieldella rifensis]|uniref:EAL domain-containing protein n=1 Tax=Litchfieldella rifensis TaxID=762643 RepID=A0ABV7LV65_9GAMM